MINLKNSKILVLGGTGFLGAQLTSKLLNENFSVRVYAKTINNHLASFPNCEFVTGDFAEGTNLEKALEDIDVVFHLISVSIPSTSNENMITDVEGNLIGSIRLLETMKRMHVKRIIFISSGGTVYGNPQVLPVSESHPLQPICSYGIVKASIENYLNMFVQLHDFKVAILRLSNPYGSSQSNIGVLGSIATFFQKINKAEPIKIWGDGSTVRDYIYINDVLAAMMAVLLQENCGVFNIGSGIGHSLNEVIDIIASIVGRKPIIEYLPSRPFDVHKIYLDISKSVQELHWQPQFSLQKGCEEFWLNLR